MTPNEIKKAIKKNNTTQKEIAKKLSVTEMSISHIVNKNQISNRIMQEIARTIGKDPCEVFPEYYLIGPKYPRRTSNVRAVA